MKTSPNAERALFISLWALLILGIALWRLWPSSDSQPPTSNNVLLEMAPEIKPWFSSGKVRSEQSNRYTLNLQLTPEYRKSLKGQNQTVHLGFQLTGKETLSHTGITPCYIDPEKMGVTLILPNPKHITAEKILLYLAD